MTRFLTLAGLTAGLLITPQTAEAHDAHGDCLHRSDFREVVWSDTPYSRWQAHQVFGTTGRVVYEDSNEETRVYQGCGEGTQDRAWVNYKLDSEGIYRVDGFSYTLEYFGDGLATPPPARSSR